jgi:tRNA U34 2-thiouridine synthase MnmA/TrmU
MMKYSKCRALGLCSGGLDSILAALVLQKQGIDVTWITFETPFFTSEKARKAAEHIGIPLIVEDIGRRYLKILKHPPAGYGRHMNPCPDCHALMFQCAGERMLEEDFSFLFSGEVLGQRPMSQTKPSIHYVEKHSGFAGRILRPLSAGLLPATLPEKEGLVDRKQLLDISGRSRRRQIALAREFDVRDYPNPGGGCLLTHAGFSNRLKDLFQHQEDYTIRDLYLLKYGRHFRFPDGKKIIIGRSHEDNEYLHQYYHSQKDALLWIRNYPGPVALVPPPFHQDTIARAAAMLVGYSKVSQEVTVDVELPEGREMFRTNGISPSTVADYLLT